MEISSPAGGRATGLRQGVSILPLPGEALNESDHYLLRAVKLPAGSFQVGSRHSS